MPRHERIKTKYPGVYFVVGTAVGSNKPERIYYIRYRKDGKMIEEKAGRQYQEDMTPARAAGTRLERIQGKQLSNIGRREAEKASREAEENKWTVDRLWERYKAQRPDLKGLAQDKSRYELYIKPLLADNEPSQILPLDIDRLRRKRLKGKSSQTVKLTLALLRRIVNFGVMRKLCDPLPFSIEMPKVSNVKTEDLTTDQLKNLLNSIEKSDDIHASNLIKLALFTGMRRGEIFKLKWNHIDFERGFIHIVDPKGGPDQKIPLNEPARELLENHPKTDSPYVFPGRWGGQRTDIKKAVNKIKDEAGLPKDFRPLHGLRHTYASMLASSGQVDMYTLQKLLTHKSPQMTQRYAHLRDETLKRAADLAGELIEQAVGSKDEAATEKDKTA